MTNDAPEVCGASDPRPRIGTIEPWKSSQKVVATFGCPREMGPFFFQGNLYRWVMVGETFIPFWAD